MRSMKKWMSVFMTVFLGVMLLSGCGNEKEPVETAGLAGAVESAADGKESQEAPAENYKACLITDGNLGNDFVDLIWKGLQNLEAEGWEIKCIEATDNSEFADDIRSMAADGYQVIMTWEDNVSQAALNLADEIYENYPETHIFLLDTYVEHDKPNCTSVSVDPFESSFVAGFIASRMTKTGTIGWIGHTDVLKIRRFRDGYIAGAAYGNPAVETVFSFTGDYLDPTKGQEAGTAMIANYPVDIIYQSCYLAGPGVIKACADGGIQCIGVDDWQGDLDPCVFWSAVKPMDVGVTQVALDYKAGKELPGQMNFDIAAGGTVYDDRDLKNIPDELRTEVKQLVEDISTGKVDVYQNFEEYRLGY